MVKPKPLSDSPILEEYKGFTIYDRGDDNSMNLWAIYNNTKKYFHWSLGGATERDKALGLEYIKKQIEIYGSSQRDNKEKTKTKA